MLLGLAALTAGCAGDYLVPVEERGSPVSREPRVVHIVRQGDTLYSIAWDAGLDYRAVARWNDISPPYVIKPGQRLRLRPGPGQATSRTASTRPSSAPRTSSTRPEPGPQEAVPAGREGWMWPARGPILRKFSKSGGNPGVDIGGKAGQTVRSAAAGRVVYSGDGLRGYGQLIIVKHNETFLSAYAHNRKLLVREGDQVQRGQPIAEMGDTGTDQVKLHFEIRKRGNAVNPLEYLPAS